MKKTNEKYQKIRKEILLNIFWGIMIAFFAMFLYGYYQLIVGRYKFFKILKNEELRVEINVTSYIDQIKKVENLTSEKLMAQEEGFILFVKLKIFSMESIVNPLGYFSSDINRNTYNNYRRSLEHYNTFVEYYINETSGLRYYYNTKQFWRDVLKRYSDIKKSLDIVSKRSNTLKTTIDYELKKIKRKVIMYVSFIILFIIVSLSVRTCKKKFASVKPSSS